MSLAITCGDVSLNVCPGHSMTLRACLHHTYHRQGLMDRYRRWACDVMGQDLLTPLQSSKSPSQRLRL